MAKKPLNILIAGDSFAAKWPGANDGWVNLLEKDYNVTNTAQAGCGEYKIYKQIESVNINAFDLVIVSHTSPSRVHTKEHPIHKEGFHKNCDLIFSDIDAASGIFNRSLRSAKEWFEFHYDDEFQIDIYNLLRNKINDIIKVPYISLSHVSIAKELAVESNHLDFSEYWKLNRGNVNHYTKEGNKAVYSAISKEIGCSLPNGPV